MNLGFVDRPTVLHEFGHSLGLIHEHQSPFKGGFEWNREEVRKGIRLKIVDFCVNDNNLCLYFIVLTRLWIGLCKFVHICHDIIGRGTKF